MADPSRAIRILVADDHPLMRDGVRALIGTEPGMVLVAEAATGREALEQFRAHRPEVTLLDLQMPGMGGLDALHGIRSEFPDARIIVLTTYAGDALVHRALKLGALAYVLKGLARKELLDTIRAVHCGHKRVHVDAATQLAFHAGDSALTEREIEVLREIAAGKSNKLIAVRLSITEETVKGHVKNILAKLDANDRTHAVMLAVRRGIIEL